MVGVKEYYIYSVSNEVGLTDLIESNYLLSVRSIARLVRQRMQPGDTVVLVGDDGEETVVSHQEE